LEEQLPEGVPIPVAWEGVDDVPILFVNQVLGQVGQQSEVILTFGQVAPPAILGQTREERERQVRALTHMPIKPIARLALTREGLEQLVGVLQQTLANHDKAQELFAQAQRMIEKGEE
jgi:hypothetical protein